MLVFLVGAAKLVDMGTSINNQIINFSKYYRFGFVAIILMAFFNVLANLMLIPEYGIVGAALATLISLGLYNLLKMLFIQWRFKMHPFGIKTLQLLLITGAIYGNILLRSILIGGSYVLIVYTLRISADFNKLLLDFLNRFLKRGNH